MSGHSAIRAPQRDRIQPDITQNPDSPPRDFATHFASKNAEGDIFADNGTHQRRDPDTRKHGC